MTGLRVETFIAPKTWISETIDLYYKAALTIDENIEKITSQISVKMRTQTI
jgi:hypothetical protein